MRVKELRMRLLVIEDEQRTRTLLSHGLREAGYVIDACDNGIDGLAHATGGEYDAIILDIMLPQMDGWSVLAGLRQHDKRTPALVLSAKEGVADRVRGLTLGADDYLVKPFAFDELLARVRAMLRRNQPIQEDPLSFADLRLDPRGYSVSRGGQRIELTAKEYQLLELLVRHQGEVLPRTLISERVWDMSFDSYSNVIEVNIRRLRMKIDDPFDRKLIHTVKGRGYVLR
jgi:two-component system, OmpR family, copper resistance phosphate regulon response regulator CusR